MLFLTNTALSKGSIFKKTLSDLQILRAKVFFLQALSLMLLTVRTKCSSNFTPFILFLLTLPFVRVLRFTLCFKSYQNFLILHSLKQRWKKFFIFFNQVASGWEQCPDRQMWLSTHELEIGLWETKTKSSRPQSRQGSGLACCSGACQSSRPGRRSST